MALEILEETGYTEIADYWSLGVIFFELCFGTWHMARGGRKERGG
jgi:hypothetical protein